jgi:LmbE family N-acetylglucosaminyl deacetylase
VKRIQLHTCFILRSLVCFSIIASQAGPVPPAPTTARPSGALQGSEEGQLPLAPPSPGSDDRFKADILVFVAHPDDETEVSAYLARAIYDEHRRVAVIFGTRGDGGGNAMGYAQSASLGEEREIEARRACAYLGIANVWFLDGPDTPAQDVLHSLETWNHGAALGKAVRIMRLTRPEVVLTWLPDYVAGENHADHQAAGVIATEAFDLAGDPTQFAEQVSFPRDRMNIGNLTEGLRPWQPKKIYYFSDASHHEFLEGQGPEYSTTAISPVRQLPYYRIAAEEMAFHLTQDDTGQEAKKALAAGQFQSFQRAVRLIFGKSLVGGTTTGDIFEGVRPAPIRFAPVRGYQLEAREGLSLELGGPWGFYRDFWKAHNIERLAQLLPTPEVSLQVGTTLHVPLLIRNDSPEPAEVALIGALPRNWKEKNGSARYPVDAHEVYPIEAAVTLSPSKEQEWQMITWKAEAKGNNTIAPVRLRVNVTLDAGLPQ